MLTFRDIRRILRENKDDESFCNDSKVSVLHDELLAGIFERDWQLRVVRKTSDTRFSTVSILRSFDHITDLETFINTIIRSNAQSELNNIGAVLKWQSGKYHVIAEEKQDSNVYDVAYRNAKAQYKRKNIACFTVDVSDIEAQGRPVQETMKKVVFYAKVKQAV
jgi:hypothetical protein